jgi:hypothetical protein
MTWIVAVGAPGIVSIIGDTAVTYGDVVARDYGVQKVWGLSELTAVGFAGSVEIGFGEVQSLGDVARTFGPRAEVPDILTEWHQPSLMTYRDRYDLEARALGCDLIITGSSDDQLTDQDGQPVSGLHRSHRYIIRMPVGDEEAASPDTTLIGAVSIGSGSTVPPYVDAIKEHALDVLLTAWNSHQQVGFRALTILGMILRHTVELYPVTGVAKSLVGVVITPDGWHADAVTRSPSDLGSVEHPLPPLARSMEDLRALQHQFGPSNAANAAVC